MKKLLFAFGLTLVFILYTSVVGHRLDSSIVDTTTHCSKENPSHQSIGKQTGFTHSATQQVLGNSIQGNPIPFPDNYSSGKWFCTRVYQLVYEGIQGNYLSISSSFLIEEKKTNLLFPFHFFW